MSILVLVTTGVYRIVQSTMQASAEIKRTHVRRNAISSFIDLCRRTFRTLPGNASVLLVQEDADGRFYPELSIDNAPRAFAFGGQSVSFAPKTLAARAQDPGLLNISLYIDEELEETVEESELLPPLILLTDIQELEWTIYDPQTDEWVDEWLDPSRRPTLIQLVLTMAGEPYPYVAVFHVPQFQRSSTRAPSATPSPRPPPTPELNLDAS